MKKYFLILLGNFEDDSKTREIIVSLSPIVDSPNLKFNQTSGSLVFYFASEVYQSEIYEYLLALVEDKCNSFFLTENNDNLSVFLPESVKGHLLDLENESLDIEFKMSNKIDDEFDEEIMALLLEGLKKSVKKPSLDEILEKILQGGFESLSEFEKETLEQYSKN